ncbi:MAG: protein translocase subunit SecF [Microbacteriaceae bacterium]
MFNFAKFGNELYTGERSYDIVGKRKIWYTIALVLIVLSVAMPFLRGVNLGIEFRGGSEFRVSQVQELNTDLAVAAVATVNADTVVRVSTIGGSTIRVQTDQLNDVETVQVSEALRNTYKVGEEDVTASYVGPSWGADVTGDALRGLLVFILLASIVMALYFRTWKMSLAAISAMLHDLIVTAGIFVLIGVEITPAAVIGFLTILGYSLYDTVVVFDKIRENTLVMDSSRSFPSVVNLAVNQTLVRSINTSVVAVLPVGSILFIGTALLGASTLRDIALSLFIGIIVGTYSTIFIAAPFYAHLREGEPQFAQKTAVKA